MTNNIIAVGDVFRIGDALVQVTQPRVFCFKLGIRMGIEGFQKQFAASLRVGFYLRVLEEGMVGADALITKQNEATGRMTIRDMMHLLYFDPDNVMGAKGALKIEALSPGWRGSFEDRVAKAD